MVNASLMSAADPVLGRFRAAVTGIYGDRIERVVLFGSRARGDGHADSDYDIAVFLRDLEDRAQDMNVLAYVATDVLYDLGAVVHAMPYRAGAYNESLPLMHEIRADGIDL
jgi:predicted nucleotidyltransferase